MSTDCSGFRFGSWLSGPWQFPTVKFPAVKFPVFPAVKFPVFPTVKFAEFPTVKFAEFPTVKFAELPTVQVPELGRVTSITAPVLSSVDTLQGGFGRPLVRQIDELILVGDGDLAPEPSNERMVVDNRPGEDAAPPPSDHARSRVRRLSPVFDPLRLGRFLVSQASRGVLDAVRRELAEDLEEMHTDGINSPWLVLVIVWGRSIWALFELAVKMRAEKLVSLVGRLRKP